MKNLLFRFLKYSFKSPFSMYSKIIQYGSSSVDTASNRNTFACFSTDINATSW